MFGLGRITQPFKNVLGGIFGGNSKPTRNKRNSILPKSSRGTAQQMALAPADIKSLLPFSADEFNKLHQSIKTAFEKKALSLINEVKGGVLKLTDLKSMGKPVQEALENAGVNTRNIIKVHEIFRESENIGFGKIMKLANTLPDIEKTLSFYDNALNPPIPSLQTA